METTQVKKEEILMKAEKKGRLALIDPAPDPTEDGLISWKQNVRGYFGSVCDDLVTEYHVPEMRSEILAALERGCEVLIKRQPVMDVPHEEAIRHLKEVFAELH